MVTIVYNKEKKEVILYEGVTIRDSYSKRLTINNVGCLTYATGSVVVKDEDGEYKLISPEVNTIVVYI